MGCKKKGRKVLGDIDNPLHRRMFQQSKPAMEQIDRLNPIALSDQELSVRNDYTLTDIRVKNTDVNGVGKVGVKDTGLTRDINHISLAAM